MWLMQSASWGTRTGQDLEDTRRIAADDRPTACCCEQFTARTIRARQLQDSLSAQHCCRHPSSKGSQSPRAIMRCSCSLSGTRARMLFQHAALCELKL